MLSKADAWQLMLTIKHLDGRTADRDDALVFATPINAALPDVTLVQCTNAVAEWHSRAHDFSQVMPGQLVEIIKSHRPSRRMTEADIGRLLENQGLDEMQLWQARRKLIKGLDSGLGFQRATRVAIDGARAYRPPQLPSKPQRSKRHHFMGNQQSDDLTLGQILGKENK